MANLKLLRKVRDKIASLPTMGDLDIRFCEHPDYHNTALLELAADEGVTEVWNQSTWFMRFQGSIDPTTHQLSCGTAGCLAGWTAILTGKVVNDYNEVLAPQGFGRMSVRGYAQEVLELTYDEAARLFDASNTLEDIDRIIEEIANGS